MVPGATIWGQKHHPIMYLWDNLESSALKAYQNCFFEVVESSLNYPIVDIEEKFSTNLVLKL